MVRTRNQREQDLLAQFQEERNHRTPPQRTASRRTTPQTIPSSSRTPHYTPIHNNLNGTVDNVNQHYAPRLMHVAGMIHSLGYNMQLDRERQHARYEELRAWQRQQDVSWESIQAHMGREDARWTAQGDHNQIADLCQMSEEVHHWEIQAKMRQLAGQVGCWRQEAALHQAAEAADRHALPRDLRELETGGCPSLGHPADTT